MKTHTSDWHKNKKNGGGNSWSAKTVTAIVKSRNKEPPGKNHAEVFVIFLDMNHVHTAELKHCSIYVALAKVLCILIWFVLNEQTVSCYAQKIRCYCTMIYAKWPSAAMVSVKYKTSVIKLPSAAMCYVKYNAFVINWPSADICYVKYKVVCYKMAISWYVLWASPNVVLFTHWAYSALL